MRFFKKRTLFSSIVICLLVILQLFSLSFADKNGNKKFEIEFNYGFNKFYMANSEVLARIKITNNFEDIEGKVQLLLDLDQSEDKEVYSAYSEDLYLLKNSTKTIDMKFFISKENTILLRILDKDGEVVWKETLKLEKAKEPNNISIDNINTSDVHKNNINIGILSDNFDKLTYLNSIPLSSTEGSNIIGENNSCTLIADLDGMFPEDKNLLRTLNMIIINDYNTENLNKNQIKALKDWIEDGGGLVIGTGANYQKTLKGLKDLTGPLDSGRLPLNEEDYTVLHNKRLDKGNVTILSFDIAMSPFVGWQGNKDFIVDLVNKYASLDTYTSQDKVYGASNHIMLTTSDEKSSPIDFIKLIFIILIFSILPIVYLILKNIGKVNKLWITIPIISLIFIIFMYICDSGIGLKSTLVNSISITQLSKISDYGTTKSTVGILGAKGKNVEVIADKNSYLYMSNTSNDISYEQYRTGEVISESTLGIGKESRIKFKNHVTDNSKFFNLEEKVSLNIKTDDINIDPEKIVGRVSNNSNINLEDVVLLYGDSYYKIGDIKKREIKDINIELKDLKNFIVGKDIISQIYPIYSDDKSTDILNSNIKSEILSDGLNDYNMSNKVNLTLVTWSKDNLIKDLKVNDSKADRIDRNLIFIPFVDYISDQDVHIPFGIIKPQVEEYPGLNIATYKPKRFSGNGHVVYSFIPSRVLSIKNLSVYGVDISLQREVTTGDINPYIYNYATNDWDIQDTDMIKIDENNINVYYDESRGVQIKLQPTNRKVLIQEPVFSAKGMLK